MKLQQPRGAGEGPLREEHQRVALMALRSTRRASAAPRCRSKRSTNSEPRRLQQRPGQRHGGHFALDDEAEARRQGRGEHDAIEVARVVADHHALALRAERSADLTVSGMPASAQEDAGRRRAPRAPLRHARQRYQQHQRRKPEGQERRQRPQAIDETQGRAQCARAGDSRCVFTVRLGDIHGRAGYVNWFSLC